MAEHTTSSTLARRGRHHVHPRAVRRPARQAVRQAGAGRGRRPAGDRRRRLRRVRRRRHRAGAQGSRPDRDPRPGVLHPDSLRQGRAGDRALRPARRGRAVAVRAADHPQVARRTGPPTRASNLGRRRGRILPAHAATPTARLATADTRGHRRAALLRRPRRDQDVRPPDDDLDGDEPARLGQLRQRPRGRQRPVRAELPVRRRTDHRRSRHHPALPAVDDRRRARHDRDLHAQAVHRPHGKRPAPAPLADRAAARRCSPATPTDDRGLGLSPIAYSFIGGILDHACALQAVIAPNGQLLQANRRTSTTASGASWAPRQATYGGNDRTHYIRVPDDQRVELRGGDGSANPYLAMAAALGAGIDGIERSSTRAPWAPLPTASQRCRRRCCTRWTQLQDDAVVAACSTPPATGCRDVLRQAQARGVLRLPQHGEPMGGRAVPDRVLI